MTVEQIQGILLNSRLQLEEIGNGIRSIITTNPEAVKIFVPRLRALQTRQAELEKKLDDIPGDLGFIWIIAGVVGSALAGLGLWTWKHHEEVSFERLQFESFTKCIDDKVKAGIAREQAEYACSKLYGDQQKGVLTDLESLVKTATIAIAGLLGVYFLIRKK